MQRPFRDLSESAFRRWLIDHAIMMQDVQGRSYEGKEPDIRIVEIDTLFTGAQNPLLGHLNHVFYISRVHMVINPVIDANNYWLLKWYNSNLTSSNNISDARCWLDGHVAGHIQHSMSDLWTYGLRAEKIVAAQSMRFTMLAFDFIFNE